MPEDPELELDINIDNSKDVVHISPSADENLRSVKTANNLYLIYSSDHTITTNIKVPLYIEDLRVELLNLHANEYDAIFLNDNLLPQDLGGQDGLFYKSIREGIALYVKGNDLLVNRMAWVNDEGQHVLKDGAYTQLSTPVVFPGAGNRSIYPFNAISYTTPVIVTISGAKHHMKNNEIEHSSLYTYKFIDKFVNKRSYSFVRSRTDIDNNTVTGVSVKPYIKYTNGLAYAADKKWLEKVEARATGKTKGSIASRQPAKPPQNAEIAAQLQADTENFSFDKFCTILGNDPKILEKTSKEITDLERRIQDIVDSFLVYGPFRGYNETKEAKDLGHQVIDFKSGNNPILKPNIEIPANETNRIIDGHCIKNDCEFYLYSIQDIEITESTSYISSIELVFDTSDKESSDYTIRFYPTWDTTALDRSEAVKQYFIDKFRWNFIFNPFSEEDNNILDRISKIFGNPLMSIDDIFIKKLLAQINDKRLTDIFLDRDNTFDFSLRDLTTYLDSITKENAWEWKENF